jgi:hypothetical protein|tara:strand:- start:227 stop:328 length:102 start_codon:yes stop_codon:yes gene_type:complete
MDDKRKEKNVDIEKKSKNVPLDVGFYCKNEHCI